MRVLYDHQIFSLQRYGGISRYFCELLGHVGRTPGCSVALALRCSANAHILQQPGLRKYWSDGGSPSAACRLLGFVDRVSPPDLSGRLQVNRRESVRLLDRQEFDVFHPTYYDPYFCSHLNDKPFVLTVHDMIHEIFAGELPGAEAAGKTALIEAADAVIAISESTRRDILRLTDADPSRITVIYHGNPLDGIAGAMPFDNGPAPADDAYLLFVGDRAGYKNFAFFIRSIAGLLRETDRLSVRCAGGPPFTAGERRLLSDLGVAGRVSYGQVDDLQLARLYRDALALVFPSRYEGFGLPVLEAFSCGCPAIISNTSSLPEVGGDAALYIDPEDAGSVLEAVRTLMDEPGRARELTLRGYERLKRFSWEKTAAETVAVYESVSIQ